MLARFLRIVNFLKSSDLKVASFIRKCSSYLSVARSRKWLFSHYFILEIYEGLSLEIGLTKLKYHFCSTMRKCASLRYLESQSDFGRQVVITQGILDLNTIHPFL
jgi:hypothetical protein